jgi:hypothetical protein
MLTASENAIAFPDLRNEFARFARLEFLNGSRPMGAAGQPGSKP